MEQTTLKPAMQKTQRQSSFELLRIIAMATCIIHHFGHHGGLDYTNTPLTLNHIWFHVIYLMGPVGMNAFFMASGYFLVLSRETGINIRKVLKLWGQVFFYSFTIYVIYALCTNSFSVNGLLRYAMPIRNELWWFATTYLILYLLHPYINQFLRSLEKTRYQQFLLALMVLWCVLPTFLNAFFESSRFLRFFTLYSVAGYLRLHGTRHSSAAYYGKRAVAMMLFNFGIGITIALLSQKWPSLAEYELYFYGTKTLTTWLSCMLVFMCFANMKIGYSKWINRISSATFAVYLIHDNEILRPLIWDNIFHVLSYQGSRRIIPYSILATCLVFCVCTLIEWLRQATVEKAYMRIVDRMDEKLSGKLAQLCGSLQRKIFGE